MTDTATPFQLLVLRAKSGDKDAFAEIYETHLTPVYRYLYVRLQNKEEAEDIVQETFLKAYQALERYELTRESFLPYLFTIARNLAINRTRKKRPDTMPQDELERNAPAGEGDTQWFTEQEERKKTVSRALLLLTESEREIIELRFFGEQTYSEIAECTGKKEDAIRQHVARAMKKMRSHLGDQEA